ncbi:hypothetical protein SORBI_3005G176000 [Sorghum bicolor]|uniref:Uncharacterized protein n=1 Tax=Sorghum bicolor TaxID=4558 RepID=A0A1B6PT63_SORBI|nr:hypothetical protein SORBI_3005G176000 [Sorghum bicolor]
MTRRRAVGRRSRSSRLQSAAYARRKIVSRISRNPVLAAAASSMLTELACNAGAMRKETLLVKFAMRLYANLQEYKPGYTAPPRPQPDETTIDIDGDLIMDLRDPRILAVAAAQRRLLEAEYDGYATTDASGAAFCRSAALILMALLLLRHALSISDNEGNDDDASTMFSLFLLRAAGFLLPCYIMAWIFSILHRRRQRQEEAALAAAEVAFILQSARGRALQFAIAPDSPATPQHEPAPQQQQ